jgi:hypothetical protein
LSRELKAAFATVGAALKLAGGVLAGLRLHGAAPLGGTFGDGKGTSRLRRKARAGMNSKASSTITPRPPTMNGRI